MKHTIKGELAGILALIALMWLVFLTDFILPVQLSAWGLIPRTVMGLPGVATMPLLHGSLSHLIGNTVPMFVLLCILAGSQADSRGTVAMTWILGGVLLWICGRPAIHIGASGLVYGLTLFLIVAGIVERRFLSIVAAIAVGLIYGGSLLAGVLPSAGSNVSWDGHLAGAVAGSCVAITQLKKR